MEKEAKIVLVILIILAVAISLLSLHLIKARLTHPKNYETHTYTKAICNSTNYCQDYIVSCSEYEVLSINPITGAAVQFSDGWKDPRDKTEINRFC